MRFPPVRRPLLFNPGSCYLSSVIAEGSRGARARAATLVVCALSFVASAIVAAVAFRAQRVVVPADGRHDFESAGRVRERELRYHEGRSFAPPLILADGTEARLDLGDLPHGAELTLVGWRGMDNRYTKIAIAIDGREVGFYNGLTGGRAGIVAHGERIKLKKIHSGRSVVLRQTKTPAWTGFVIVQPQPRAAQFARWALPITSALLLLALAWWRPRPALFVPALGLVLTFLYWHTLATAKIGPMADYFFSDSLDFVRPLMQGQFTSDMAKHLLFFPLARGLYLLFALVGLQELTALSAVFVTFGVANALLAWAWMSRMMPGPRSAALLAVVHAFSFAPWAFASHFETYAASAAAAHGVLWLLARGTIRSTVTDTLLQAGAGAGAALLHPPLLVLPVLGVLRFADLPVRRRVLRTGATMALSLVLFGAGSLGLRAACGTPVDKAIVQADTSSSWRTFNSYARPENRTLQHVATVINGQCALAFAGVHFPAEWARPAAPVRGYARSAAGAIAGLLLLAFWIGGLAGAWSDRQVLLAQAAGAVLVVLPSLLFYWLFNPAEMLLYSPPLLGAILVGLGGGWLAMAGERRTLVVLTVLAFALAVHNGLCLASFP